MYLCYGFTKVFKRILFGKGPGGWDSWDGWDGWDIWDQQINRPLEGQFG